MNSAFLDRWQQAIVTSLGFFWMALWAFALGYLISSLIQTLVSHQRMKDSMGEAGPRSMAMGTFFGFISSSCSFAALATTRALFQKGAGLAPAMAFLLASTNLVIELGIVIAVFLGWQFVAGEYAGGVILVLYAWWFIRITRPAGLIAAARKKVASGEDSHDSKPDWRRKLATLEGWQEIGKTYVMEWRMIWKDVLIGFTLAGIISSFVPDTFFEALFTGSAAGGAADPGMLAVLEQTLVGPLAAFLTFIGSMGNIPLAALLFDHGVSFAGVMAFIFSDLVVLPVLRINASYYGWKMALYILAMLLSGLVVTSLVLHYGLALFDALPRHDVSVSITDRDFFQWNYTSWLNILFLAITAVLLWFWRRGAAGEQGHGHDHGDHASSWSDKILLLFVSLSLAWLAGGSLLVILAAAA